MRKYFFPSQNCYCNRFTTTWTYDTTMHICNPPGFTILQTGKTQDSQNFSFKTIKAFNDLMYRCSETKMMDMLHWEPINKKYISIYVDGGNEMRWMFFFMFFFWRSVFNEPEQ